MRAPVPGVAHRLCRQGNRPRRAPARAARWSFRTTFPLRVLKGKLRAEEVGRLRLYAAQPQRAQLIVRQRFAAVHLDGVAGLGLALLKDDRVRLLLAAG